MSEEDRQKWNERYRLPSEKNASVEPFLESLEDVLPRYGAALDVAGGTGRNALWLARRGLDVTLVDISPLALRQAAQLAVQSELHLATIQADLDFDPLPAGPWNVIVVSHFLWRSLFETARDLLSPDGWLVYIQPTRRNLERHVSPSERFLVGEDELPQLAQYLHIEHYSACWRASGRHEAWLLARNKQNC